MKKNWNDDHYTKKARREDYEARSVYKLEEIDKRERILRGSKLILDLGASPGSWSQYCLKMCPHAEIYAVDLSPLEIEDPRLHFFQDDIEKVSWEAILNGAKADVVLSDMAPNTSGQHDRDVYRSLEVAEMALGVALAHLKKKGSFVVKVFMGIGFEEYHKKVKGHFETVRLLRPDSTRKQSREIFMIGKSLR